MAANFIFDGPDKMRTTSFTPAIHYDIGDLNFYVSTKFGQSIQVFLILKNRSGLYEIVELAKAGNTNQNILYKMPLNQTLRITDEFVDMQIMVLDYEASTYHISKTTSLYITTEQYQLARQVFIAQEVGKTVQDCYAKILALTERNTDMYNTIVRKGEN